MWFKSIPIFETKLNISKIQNKNMVSFIFLLGATLIIFVIFEHVLMPQINCQSVLFSNYMEKQKRKKCQEGVFAI